MSLRHLQITSALLGAVPVATGLISMLGINDPLYAALNLPLLPFVGFTVLEIVGAPLFVWWQHRLGNNTLG